MAASTRLYLIEVTHDEKTAKHLVDAANPASGVRHVVKQMVKVSVPTAREVASLVASGLSVETAGADA